MQYVLTTQYELKKGECLVLGVHSDVPLPDILYHFDKSVQDLINQLAQRILDSGDALWQADIDGASLLLVQCGEKAKYTPASLRQRLIEITESLIKYRITSATLCMPALANKTPNWQLEFMLLAMDHAGYQFLDFKKQETKPHGLAKVAFYLPEAQEESLLEALAIAAGVTLTRELADTPANVCTPSYLAEKAQQLAKQHKQRLSCKVLEPKEMQKMGMNTLLAVAQGSREPARFIELQYQGAKNQAPIVLVGKGITFDSGGLCIKPALGMEEMKYDMCGAATVLGVIKACALMQLPIHLIGIIASTENMPGGSAVKPGDVVTSMSGQTVEIINTDAEGRLILADALTYVERFNPAFVIDIATLTGAMIIALGRINTGFMTNSTELSERIRQASQDSEDLAWEMPMDEAYQAAIESPIADILNSNFDRTAGSITAACFLSRFTSQYPWAHLDVAGTAWVSGSGRVATGRPVPLLMQLIRHALASR